MTTFILEITFVGLAILCYYYNAQGVRDAAVELLHTLVAVHAEVLDPCLYNFLFD